MKTSDLWNKFIANTFNEKKMNFSYSDFEKAINERIQTELRWIPIEELNNPTIPFLCKDRFGRIELFKFTSIKYLKAIDVVEWRNIL